MDRNEEIKKVSELLYNDYIGKGWKNVSLEGCERQAINYIDVRDLVKKLTIADVVATLPQDPIVLARYMHDAYEMLAKNNDWNTQENCKVDFSDLPIGNKNTMILLAGKLILDFGGN
tara:strand:- start:316 stop:666 length:351 start_codon:yes stop_codon:yes gene_type:complete